MAKVEGLPEGVELVRIGKPKADEFYIVGSKDVGSSIQSPGTAPPLCAVVVKPAEGWSFRWDIRRYAYVPCQMLPDPKSICRQLTFTVEAVQDQQDVEDLCVALELQWAQRLAGRKADG